MVVQSPYYVWHVYLSAFASPLQGQAGDTMQPSKVKGGKRGQKKSSSSSSKEGVDDDALLAEAVKENSTCFFPK